MVEIEEITDEDAKQSAIKAADSTTAPTSKNTKPLPPGKKRRVPKKELPSVAYLLAHGAPESQGKPKSFCDVFGYPIFVAICFAISLLIFHYAPHEKSVQPRGKFTLPKKHQHYKINLGNKKAQQESQAGENVEAIPDPVASEKAPNGEL